MQLQARSNADTHAKSKTNRWSTTGIHRFTFASLNHFPLWPVFSRFYLHDRSLFIKLKCRVIFFFNKSISWLPFSPSLSPSSSNLLRCLNQRNLLLYKLCIFIITQLNTGCVEKLEQKFKYNLTLKILTNWDF